MNREADLTTGTESAIERMARWIGRLTFVQIPDEVRRVATHAILDTSGVMAAGSATPVAMRARAALSGLHASGDCDILGLSQKACASAAAFANGVAAHALDFDDNSYAGFVHASAVIVPAALAAIQSAGRSGADLITAYVAGAECELALAQALGREPYNLGWWTTGLYGAVGACAAACCALRLTGSQTASALGLAAAGSGGMKAIFGTDAKAILVGETAEAGVRAALLARAGSTGPVRALDGPSGLAALVNAGAFDCEAVDGLGIHWNTLSPGIDVKRIPVCLSSHAAVDALRELIDEGLDVTQVERVVCDVPPIVVRNLKYAEPVTPQQAQFSMQYSIAATLLLGDVSMAALTAETVNRPDMIRAMRAVSMTTSSLWDDPVRDTEAPEGAHIRVSMRGGQTVERYRSKANGSTAYPLSTQAIGQKFLECATHAMSRAQASRSLAALTNLAGQTDARTLFN